MTQNFDKNMAQTFDPWYQNCHFNVMVKIFKVKGYLLVLQRCSTLFTHEVLNACFAITSNMDTYRRSPQPGSMIALTQHNKTLLT